MARDQRVVRTDSPSWKPWARAALAFLAVAGAAQAGVAKTYIHPNGDVLWSILSQHCVQPYLASHAVQQCQLVSGVGRPGGYVLLKSNEGVAQYLLMPADKVTGMEDPILLGPAPTNYLAKAWYARGFVEALLHRPLQADQVSVAINSGEGRSQDQLHLHIDCIRADVRQTLAEAAIAPAPFQTRVDLLGHPYRVATIPAAQLETTDPFLLLMSAVPEARAEMGEWTLVLTGAPQSQGGDRTLLLLAAKADLPARIYASGEELQDHGCGVLPAGATK